MKPSNKEQVISVCTVKHPFVHLPLCQVSGLIVMPAVASLQSVVLEQLPIVVTFDYCSTI